MSTRTKRKSAKWILRKLRVRWFCRNCHQRGLCDINAKMVDNITPTTPEIVHIVEVTCHTDCRQPDIRLHVHHENPKAVH